MALVQIMQLLARDKDIGKRIVPIVPDEGRTFGMEGMYRQLGIWSHVGQLYTPEDAAQLAFYREDEERAGLPGGHHRGRLDVRLDRGRGVVLDARQPMIPFYVFYSMFGFQRIGDLAWAAADMRCRGFLSAARPGAPR